jgi:hypothetical protein
MGIDMAADVEEGAAVASIADRRHIASFRTPALDTILSWKPLQLCASQLNLV